MDDDGPSFSAHAGGRAMRYADFRNTRGGGNRVLPLVEFAVLVRGDGGRTVLERIAAQAPRLAAHMAQLQAEAAGLPGARAVSVVAEWTVAGTCHRCGQVLIEGDDRYETVQLAARQPAECPHEGPTRVLVDALKCTGC